MQHRSNILRPGVFSVQASADCRRDEFDYKNEIIISNNVPVDFVFIGDSITHYWELNAYFGRKNKLVLNRGISGDVTEYLKKRFEADVLQLKPEYAVMKVGINDTWMLDFYCGEQELITASQSIKKGITDNISSIIKTASNVGQKIVLCSVLPTNMLDNKCNERRNEMILDINKRLEEIALNNNAIYVDYHSHMTKSDGKTLMDGLSDDGLHPHVLGYNIMAKVLRETLEHYGIEI